MSNCTWEEEKKETLAFSSRVPGIGSVEKHERARILSLKGTVSLKVQVDSIDHLIATGKLKKPDFVKIDVQGEEMNVLLGMNKTIQDYKPRIFVEIHYVPYIDWKIENLSRIFQFLTAEKYSIYHVESGRLLDSRSVQEVGVDEHLYCF